MDGDCGVVRGGRVVGMLMVAVSGGIRMCFCGGDARPEDGGFWMSGGGAGNSGIGCNIDWG